VTDEIPKCAIIRRPLKWDREEHKTPITEVSEVLATEDEAEGDTLEIRRPRVTDEGEP
jgi:hypothetical protein